MLLGRLGVVVVALERTDARGVHDLADALVRVHEPAVARRSAPRLLGAVLVDDLHARRPTMPSAPGALLGVAVDRDAAFGRAVRVDDLDAEAARELVDDLRRALVAERDAQRVVGVVGLLRAARAGTPSGLPV